MQLAIDGLIALVVVVSHLVILARIAYLDVFTYRYIPYVIVVTSVKWLAKVLWQIDIPDAIYLLVFIFLEKPQALREEKYFCAFFAPVFWTLITSFFSFYFFRVFFNKPRKKGRTTLSTARIPKWFGTNSTGLLKKTRKR